MTVIGKITSKPDADGNHKFKCPKCRTSFLAPVMKDDQIGELLNVVCKACHYADEPLAFMYAANEAKANAMAKDYVERELAKSLKKAFGGSKNIRLM